MRSGVRTNPRALAEEFLEDKYEALTSLQAAVYGMHVWAQRRKPGQQTIDRMMMDEVDLVTGESVGICAPGHAMIRHFFLAVTDKTYLFKLSWCVISSHLHTSPHIPPPFSHLLTPAIAAFPSGASRTSQ